MRHRLASVLLAALAVAAGAPRLVGSEHEPAPSVEVLVNGTPQTRYAHHGRWYIEALRGREYAIQVRNPYAVRVAVALSVDGLNTIDARETTADAARKWVLDPHETVVISGWQTSRTEARRFEFTTEERSYGQALGKTANFGVITAVFYKERVPEVSTANGAGRFQPRSRAPEPSAAPPSADSAARSAKEEYAATGMGRRTDHAVSEVRVNLEDVPAHSVNIRYEFRPQLVKLGIVPSVPHQDPLRRRERARGFEPGFAPVPPSLR